MAPPTSYTESALAEYMVSELRSVGSALGWTAANMAEAVNNAVLAYGATDIAACTDIPKIRALARLEAWRAAAAEVSGDFDFKDGPASYSRSQLQELAMKMVRESERAALLYSPVYKVRQQPITHEDPYQRSAYETPGL